MAKKFNTNLIESFLAHRVKEINRFTMSDVSIVDIKFKNDAKISVGSKKGLFEIAVIKGGEFINPFEDMVDDVLKDLTETDVNRYAFEVSKL